MSEKDPATVAVTGVTGALGSRIAARLAEHGIPKILVGRSPDRIPELPGAQRRGPAAYGDASGARGARWRLDAHSGLRTPHGAPTGGTRHRGRGRDRGRRGEGPVCVPRRRGAHRHVHQRPRPVDDRTVPGRGRDSPHGAAGGFYTSTPAALANEEFVVSGAASTGRAAFVTHEDIADVITAVALDEGRRSEHDGAILEITGPEALTLDEAVTRIAAATGRPYRYEAETLEEAFARRWREGKSGEQIETWISWYQAIEWCEVSMVTDVVPRLTGSPATPISDAAWWPAPKTARGLR